VVIFLGAADPKPAGGYNSSFGFCKDVRLARYEQPVGGTHLSRPEALAQLAMVTSTRAPALLPIRSPGSHSEFVGAVAFLGRVPVALARAREEAKPELPCRHHP
jgi:hypothetical protein